MQKQQVIRHFGSQAKVAKVLGLTRSAIHQWPEIIPELRALQLEKLTNGDLSVTDPLLEAIQ